MTSQQPLRIEVDQGHLIVRGGQQLLQRALDSDVVGWRAQGPADRPGYQQVALDVAAAPGEELEPGRTVGCVPRAAAIPIENAQPAAGRRFVEERAKV
jgi:hypothetical protein